MPNFSQADLNKLRYLFDLVVVQYRIMECFRPGENVTTGDNKHFVFIVPELDGASLTYVHAEHAGAGASGTSTFQIRKGASTDMLSTLLTIDAGETGSDTAATPAVIKSDGSEVVSSGDTLHVDIDAVQSSPVPDGLVVTLGFTVAS